MSLSVRWTSVKNSRFILPFLGVKIEAAHKIRTARQTREQSSTVLQPANTCSPPTHIACKSIVDVCHKILFIFSEGSGF